MEEEKNNHSESNIHDDADDGSETELLDETGQEKEETASEINTNTTLTNSSKNTKLSNQFFHWKMTKIKI